MNLNRTGGGNDGRIEYFLDNVLKLYCEIHFNKTFYAHYVHLGWVVGIRPIVRMWDLGLRGGVSSVGDLSKRSEPVFTLVSEKTTEKSERLGRERETGD